MIELVTAILLGILIAAVLKARENRRLANYAETQWWAWQKSSLEALGTWVEYLHGEDGKKAFRNFTRYNPPEVVLACLPHAPEGFKKSKDIQKEDPLLIEQYTIERCAEVCDRRAKAERDYNDAGNGTRYARYYEIAAEEIRKLKG